MTFVPFATVCESCHKRGEEYQAFPICRECGKHVCGTCRSLDWDDPEHGTGVCNDCATPEGDK